MAQKNTPEVSPFALIWPDVPRDGLVYSDQRRAVIGTAFEPHVLVAARRLDDPPGSVVRKGPLLIPFSGRKWNNKGRILITR